MTNNTVLSQVQSLQQLGRVTYGLVPIAAGADKFTNLLTHWSNYVSPGLQTLLPFSADTFMMIVGVVEIVAGLFVLSIPRIGAWIVAAWLLIIACTLVLSGTYLDVAVRDIVMALGAYVLARLTGILESKKAQLN
ncbi:MAG: hypothetical protein WBO28_07085 [Flavobacteriales bacterium]|jgi:uncharacterized membrane protein YphA (DoxX/SURF4 family)|nr:hypothetical protein [Flavobacteriales bacterium]